MILLRKILNDFGFHLTFHNVGQGLFYTGVINYKNNQYSFVFDCGSNTLIKGELDKRISKFKKKLLNDTIHLLIISHFHEDHINGLDILLRGTTVKTVVMPYMTLTERLFIACTNINRFSTDWYFEFLIDPVNFIMDRGKVQQIILISRGEDNFSDGENLGFPDEPSDFDPEIPFDYKKLGDKRGNKYLYDKILNENPSWENFLVKGKLIPKTHNGYGLLVGVWLFRFFNLRKSLSNLNKKLRMFEECLKKTFGVDDLKSIDKGIIIQELRKRRSKLKNCYKKVFGKGNNKVSYKSDNLNLTSLAVFHMPVEKIGLCQFKYMNIELLSRKAGELLTGDIDLSDENYLKEFKIHFSKFINNTVLFQIPHHGSKNSWNKKLLEIFPDTPIWIVCAGEKNKYKHPHKRVLYDINEMNRFLFRVNEKLLFTIKSIDCQIMGKQPGFMITKEKNSFIFFSVH